VILRQHRPNADGPAAPAFEARALGFRYPDAPRPALEGVTFSVPRGALYGILGPNGSGKSTLLRLLLGTLPPASGEVRYEGRELGGWGRRELAREVGVVPQGEEAVFPLSVRELVAMGRYPHLGAWKREGALDREAIEDALLRCDVAHLSERPLATLSGGERQRARIARALAQRPRTLVLDEPTAALDVKHEMAIFELLASLARHGGVSVVVVTHNLNLAARYADRLLLLDRGRVAAEGAPECVLEQERLEAVYGWPVAVTTHPGPGPDAGAPQVVPLARRAEAPEAAVLVTMETTGDS
jgi:iron complex transport system ATP-binding protein